MPSKPSFGASLAPFWPPWDLLASPFDALGTPFGPLGAVLRSLWSHKARSLEPPGARRPPKVDPSCPSNRKIAKSDAFRCNFAVIFGNQKPSLRPGWLAPPCCLAHWAAGLPARVYCMGSLSACAPGLPAPNLSTKSARLKYDKLPT